METLYATRRAAVLGPTARSETRQGAGQEGLDCARKCAREHLTRPSLHPPPAKTTKNNPLENLDSPRGLSPYQCLGSRCATTALHPLRFSARTDRILRCAPHQVKRSGSAYLTKRSSRTPPARPSAGRCGNDTDDPAEGSSSHWDRSVSDPQPRRRLARSDAALRSCWESTRCA
jgi:hypothetical protein